MKTKAAVLYDYGEPLIIETVDLDHPREGEVLVKMMAAGLCHSDVNMMTRKTTLPLPFIVGHEGAGVVQEVGAGVTRVKPGDHVVLLWVPFCGKCYFCKRGQTNLCIERENARKGTMSDGSCRIKKGNQDIHIMSGVGTFSAMNVVNEKSVLPIPDSIPFDIAAITGCSVITGVGSVLNKVKVTRGSSVAVIGSGGVGLNVIQGALLSNATKIIAIDLLDQKLDWATQFGATHVINSSNHDVLTRIMEITNGIGVDYAFVAVGSAEALETAYKVIRTGGYAVMVGIAKPTDSFSLAARELPMLEKSIIGSYYGSANVATDLPFLLELYEAGRLAIDKLITSRYKLDEINQGFKDLESGVNARGVIIY